MTKRALSPIHGFVLAGLSPLVFCSSFAVAATPHYSVVSLGDGQAWGINRRGEVCGQTGGSAPAACVWRRGDRVIFSFPGSPESAAYAINDSGVVAGTVWGNRYRTSRPFVATRADSISYRQSGSAQLDEAWAINSLGTVCGYSTQGAAETITPTLWSPALSTFDPGNGGAGAAYATAISDSGWVVGYQWYQGGYSETAYLKKPSGIVALANPAGYAHAEAQGLTAAGDVCGEAWTSSGTYRPCLWRAGSVTPEFVGPASPGGYACFAFDINGALQIVGSYYTPGGAYAFVWENGQFYDLNTLVDAGSPPLERATAISDCGVIVGYGASGAWLLVPDDSTLAVDTDGDGLLDRWEICGIDANRDGWPELTLQNANPQHKDIYVEVDGMLGYAPPVVSLDRVVSAFAAVASSDLPTPNPDGLPGITVHFERSELDLPHAVWPEEPDSVLRELDAIKALHFGPPRATPDDTLTVAARRLAYHYCVAADSFGSVGYTGLGEINGNDFLTTIGTVYRFFPDSLWEDYEASVMMHELGHNLGLHHGGGDDLNYKPNYYSIMNYMWSYPLSTPQLNSTRYLDYGYGGSPSLDESALDEAAGVRLQTWLPGAHYTEFWDPAANKLWLITAGLHVDWNGDGFLTAMPVQADVNYFPSFGTPASPGEVLSDHDDWASLDLNFRDDPDFADGSHVSLPPSEISTQEIRAMAQTPGFLVAATDPPARNGGDTFAFTAASGFGGPSVQFAYALPAGAHVTLRVFDSAGRTIATVLDAARPAGAGTAVWDGRTSLGVPVARGLYFARLSAGPASRSVRIIVIP